MWLICDSSPFYAQVDTCSPTYTDEEQIAKVDSETVCLRLLTICLIVLLRLWVLSIELYFQVHFFLQEPVNFIVKLRKRNMNNYQKFSQTPSQCAISTL